MQSHGPLIADKVDGVTALKLVGVGLSGACGAESIVHRASSRR